jgi:hypothetical protein
MRLIEIDATDDKNHTLTLRFSEWKLEEAQAVAQLLGEDVVVLKAAQPAVSPKGARKKAKP